MAKTDKKKKRDYWDRHPLFKTGAEVLIAFGQNCNGKSYQAKEEGILEQAYKNGKRFFYIRRMVDEVNQDKATLYFSDMPVRQLTNGEWEGVEGWRGLLYFYRFNDKGKKERSGYIGAYDSLYNWQKIKSVAWVDFYYIIFEEFISSGYYLDDEPTILQRCMSAIFRDHKGTILMLGNSISRTVPYFMQWCPNVYKQKQGTIEMYHYHTEVDGEEVDIDIAVEYCGHIKGTGLMAFGQAAKTILSGEWDVIDEPKLPKPRTFYEMVYEVLLKYQTFAFVLQLLVDPQSGVRLLYVYPYTKDRKIPRVITDKFSEDPNVTRHFKGNAAEMYIRECFNNGKMVFSDNLTAADFKGVYKQMGL